MDSTGGNRMSFDLEQSVPPLFRAICVPEKMTAGKVENGREYGSRSEEAFLGCLVDRPDSGLEAKAARERAVDLQRPRVDEWFGGGV